MRQTTTIMEYLQSELINSGKNEFVNDNQLTFFDDDYAFIKKIVNYDDDVKKIVDKRFFAGFKFDGQADTLFKRAFVTHFIDRYIAFQTIDVFQHKLTSLAIMNQTYIEEIFNNLDKFIEDNSTSKTNANADSTHDDRRLESELPQDNINLNVDDTILDYGNNNTIDRQKNQSTNDSTTTNSRYDINSLLQSNKIIERLMNYLDKRLFSQFN